MKRPQASGVWSVLLFALLLSGHSIAFGQRASNPHNPLLPSVNLGLSLPKVGVGLSAVTPPVVVPRTIVGVPAALPVPMVTTTVAPPIASAPSLSATAGGQGGSLSVNVPSVGGLTPPLQAGVNVGAPGSGPLLEVEVGVGVPGAAPGETPAPNFTAPDLVAAAQGQPAANRLDHLPTYR